MRRNLWKKEKDYRWRLVKDGLSEKIQIEKGGKIIIREAHPYPPANKEAVRRLMESKGRMELRAQITGEEVFPRTLKEMRKIFNGAEEVIVPKFITSFPKDYRFEVGGVIRAYPLKIKDKKIVVIAPRKDPTLVANPTYYSEDGVDYTEKFNLLYAGPDKRRAKHLRKLKGIGLFHTHPGGPKYNRPSFSDLVSAGKEFYADLVVGSSKVSLILPFDVTKNTKLRTEIMRLPNMKSNARPRSREAYISDSNPHGEKAKLVRVTVKPDKEVWNLLRKAKKKLKYDREWDPEVMTRHLQ